MSNWLIFQPVTTFGVKVVQYCQNFLRRVYSSLQLMYTTLSETSSGKIESSLSHSPIPNVTNLSATESYKHKAVIGYDASIGSGKPAFDVTSMSRLKIRIFDLSNLSIESE